MGEACRAGLLAAKQVSPFLVGVEQRIAPLLAMLFVRVVVQDKQGWVHARERRRWSPTILMLCIHVELVWSVSFFILGWVASTTLSFHVLESHNRNLVLVSFLFIPHPSSQQT